MVWCYFRDVDCRLQQQLSSAAGINVDTPTAEAVDHVYHGCDSSGESNVFAETCLCPTIQRCSRPIIDVTGASHRLHDGGANCFTGRNTVRTRS